MADSVELLLDPPSELVLLEDWAVLEAAGLPNQSRHLSFSNSPHVTLAAAATMSAITASAGMISFFGWNLTVISFEVKGRRSGAIRSVIGRPFSTRSRSARTSVAAG